MVISQRGDFSAGREEKRLTVCVCGGGEAERRQRAAPREAQLLCQIILGRHCQARRVAALAIYVKRAGHPRDKANDAGDNAELSQDASLLERNNVLMRLAGFHVKQRDS